MLCAAPRYHVGPPDHLLSSIVIKLLVRYVFIVLIALPAAAPASAQLLHQRQLPKQGTLGELGPPLALPMVQIGREVLRVAPGGVLYDASNRAILHSALPAEGAVWYTTDANGDVQRLYILTPAEQAMLESMPR